VFSITRKLGKLRTKGLTRRKLYKQSRTIRQLKQERDRYLKTIRTKNKLIKRLRKRIGRDDLELWSRVRLIRQQDQSAQGTINSDEHTSIKTQADIDNLALTLFPQTTRSPSDELPLDILGQHEPIWINDQELDTVEHMIWNKRYTGPDGIRFTVFKRIVDLGLEIIRDLARMSFAVGHIPDHCKETLGTLIPEKAPGKYRVVHIASPLTAYLELIALNRLKVALETKNLKDQNQFGFCKAKGRHDLMTMLITGIARHRVSVKKKYSDKATAPHNLSTIIGLDVKGAFDNVSQVSIICKLYRGLYDNPIRHWLRAFMLNRSIRVKLVSLGSGSFALQRGVPQGSALGPILWNYSISDIRKSPEPPV